MNFRHINRHDKILAVMRHPAFGAHGKFLFPWDEAERYNSEMTMADAPALHLWHTNMNVEEMLNGVNRLIDDAKAGNDIAYNFYTAEERRKDSSKKNTCLFFLRGKPGAPFAVVCPGGGFYYVGSLHEGFPIAQEINRFSYNAFVLKYRVGYGARGEAIGSRDLVAAVEFILKHAEILDVDTENYSVWGGSAGARMCSNATYGEGGLKRGRDKLIYPATAVMAYTYFDGTAKFSADDSPAFLIVGTDDWIVPWQDVLKRKTELEEAGVTVECHILKNTQHGFGVGRGTPAQGWIERAVRFWEKNFSA